MTPSLIVLTELLKLEKSGQFPYEPVLLWWLGSQVKFIFSRIKKKAEAEGNNCHAKTMWRQEKPIQLVWKTPHMFRLGSSSFVVYLQQNKKKTKAEGNNCHAKTMWRQEKPIQLVWKIPHMRRLGKSPRVKYEGRGYKRCSTSWTHIWEI